MSSAGSIRSLVRRQRLWCCRVVQRLLASDHSPVAEDEQAVGHLTRALNSLDYQTRYEDTRFHRFEIPYGLSPSPRMRLRHR